MPVTLEQFARQLTDSGLVAADEIGALRAASRATDAEHFARELVKQKRLTAFQAQQVYAGKGKSLVLGNYVILDKLGQGGMGMVLKAEHRRMKRLVALKVLSPNVTKTKEIVARFHREVQAAAKLEHPNIVSAYDADEANGTHFFVMQYVEGEDLSSLVRSKGPLPVESAVNCILQAARGLEFAHRQGVIHRDIKPANLLLDVKGVVKILDMGLARIEGDTGAQAEITNTGAVMGTVDYMAPEQARNTKTADARSDIYSLGISLWYLLVAKPAYNGQTLTERLLAHQSDPIPSLCVARNDVPAALDAVFQKLVAKRPADRYQTMSAVIEALEGALRGEAAAAPSLPVARSDDSKFSEFLAGLASTDAGSGGTAPRKTAVPTGIVTEEFQHTQSSTAPEAATDPLGLTPLTRRSQVVRRSVSRHPWWADRRVQLGGGGAAALAVVVLVAFSATNRTPAVVPAPAAAEVVRTLLPNPGLGQDLANSFSAPAAGPLPPLAAYAPSGPVVDLFQYIDVAKGTLDKSDQPRWRWLDGRRALSAETSNSHVRLPIDYRAPEAYALEARLTPRSEGRRRFVSIGLRSGAHQFSLEVDRMERGGESDLDRWCGLSLVDGLTPVRNGTGVQGTFLTVGQTLALRIEVRPDAVVVAVDGRTIVDFRGPMVRLSEQQSNAGDQETDFWLLTHEKTEFQSLTMTPLALPPRDYALNFDGDDVASAPIDFDFSEPFTLEVRTQLQQQPAKDQDICLMVKGAGGQIILRALTTGEWNVVGTGGIWYGDAPFTVGQPTRLAFSYNGTTLRLFVDGQLVSPGKGNRVQPGEYREGGVKGARYATLSLGVDGYNGLIDEVRVSSVARYDADYTPTPRLKSDPQTVALYHFDDGDGNTFADSSGHKRDGNVLGATWARADGGSQALPWIEESALSFHDGSWVDLPSLAGALDLVRPMTVEAWVTPKAEDHKGQVPVVASEKSYFGLHINNSGNWDFRVAWDQPLPVIDNEPAVYTLTHGGGAHKTRRYHVAFVRTESQFHVFLDGLLGETKPAPPQALRPLRQAMAIGGQADKGFFHGLVDEVRFSRVARYEKEFTPLQRFAGDADTIALYHFDEGRGDVLKDSSDNGHDGTIVKADWVKFSRLPELPTTSAAPFALEFGSGGAPPDAQVELTPPGGYALLFDGDDYVQIEDVLNYVPDACTIETYVRVDAYAARGLVGSLSERNSLGLDFAEGNKWGLSHVLDPMGYLTAQTNEPIEPGRRIHLAGVCDKDRFRIYVDGKLAGTSPPVRGRTFTVGRKLGRIGTQFHGAIDEVRISKTARYSSDFTPAARHATDSDTLVLYRFDEGTGDVLKDSSGNKNHGKIVDATWVPASDSAK